MVGNAQAPLIVVRSYTRCTLFFFRWDISIICPVLYKY